MCGIFGLTGRDNTAPQKVFRGLADIEYRGYDSWGIAFPHNGNVEVIKRVGLLPEKLNLPPAETSIGHTRWATHGGVTEANAHPHTDCQKKLSLVHNGIVENYESLREKLEGHSFKSDTDSEVIVHMIEEELQNGHDLVQSLSKVFPKLEGLNAVVVSDGKNIAACKKGSPLVVGKEDNEFIVASDPNAILPYTKDLIFLEDNQLALLNNEVKTFEVKDLKPLHLKFQKVSWQYSNVKLKNYKHYMLKEIFEQPQTLRNLLKNSSQTARISSAIRNAFGTYLIGCGSASYACLTGVYLFSKFAKKHVNFSLGSEFKYIEDYLTPKSLLIPVSQSGETIDVVEPITAAKEKGSKIASITNTQGSTIYRLSDVKLLLQAGAEKAVCATKSFTSMIGVMILLSFAQARKTKEGERILESSAKEIEGILRRRQEIIDLASRIYQKSHIFCLGRGLSYPIALESALKIKEVSYIHAEGFAAGELKHGVIALIEKDTPVIVFVPEDETKAAVLDNAMEVKSRGAYVIGIGPKPSPIFDYFFKVRDCGASSIIPHAVFCQLLSYYIAVKLNLNPDKPRNLAKSVVVR